MRDHASYPGYAKSFPTIDDIPKAAGLETELAEHCPQARLAMHVSARSSLRGPLYLNFTCFLANNVDNLSSPDRLKETLDTLRAQYIAPSRTLICI